MRTLQHKIKFYVICDGKKELERHSDKATAETMYYAYCNAVSNGWLEVEKEIMMKKEYKEV